MLARTAALRAASCNTCRKKKSAGFAALRVTPIPQQIIVVLSPRRWSVDNLISSQQFPQYRRCRSSRRIIVQTQHNAGNMGCILQIPRKRRWQLLILLPDTSQRQCICLAPVLPPLLQQCQVGKGINGALKNAQGRTVTRCHRHCEGISLVAAGHLAHKALAMQRPPLHGGPVFHRQSLRTRSCDAVPIHRAGRV